MGSACGLRGTDVTQVLGTTTHLRSTAVHDALAARLGPLCGARARSYGLLRVPTTCRVPVRSRDGLKCPADRAYVQRWSTVY